MYMAFDQARKHALPIQIDFHRLSRGLGKRIFVRANKSDLSVGIDKKCSRLRLRGVCRPDFTVDVDNGRHGRTSAEDSRM